MTNFNSRPSARGDCLACVRISSLPYFNSRPSARGDVLDEAKRQGFPVFQFTPLREGRHNQICVFARHGYFNSRPSARGDYEAGQQTPSVTFQFTPLREGRRSQPVFPAKKRKFQFTPLREGRRTHLEQLGRHVYFNSRPSARGDAQCGRYRFGCANYFNSRPSARGDELPPRDAVSVAHISIHAPPRGATSAGFSCACS